MMAKADAKKVPAVTPLQMVVENNENVPSGEKRMAAAPSPEEKEGKKAKPASA